MIRKILNYDLDCGYGDPKLDSRYFLSLVWCTILDRSQMVVYIVLLSLNLIVYLHLKLIVKMNNRIWNCVQRTITTNISCGRLMTKHIWNWTRLQTRITRSNTDFEHIKRDVNVTVSVTILNVCDIFLWSSLNNNISFIQHVWQAFSKINVYPI